MDFLKYVFRGDKVIWIIFLLLCVLSVFEVFSASSTLAYSTGNYWAPLTRHSIFLLVGVGVVLLFHNINYKYFQVIPFFLLPLSIVLLAYLTITGIITNDHGVNGAARWFEKGGVSFQPSELAKMALVIAAAYILSRGQDEHGAHPKAFKYITILTFVVVGLIFPENYSTAALLFCTILLMMFIGRVQMRKLVLLVSALCVGLVLFVTFLELMPDSTLNKIPGGHRFTTWKARINDFARHDHVAPAKFDIDGDGQVAHARIAIATSNVVGKGPGNSVERDFLAHAYSDFIYSIIIEELGLVGGVAVVFLYVCLLIRVGRIAKKCNRTFPALLITGITLLLVIQAMFNMMVAVGLAPVTGQPLPLVSMGGTSILINCAYVGMILSVSRYTAQLDELRAHDARIEMQISTGYEEEMAVVPATASLQAVPEPMSEALNSDTEMI